MRSRWVRGFLQKAKIWVDYRCNMLDILTCNVDSLNDCQSPIAAKVGGHAALGE